MRIDWRPLSRLVLVLLAGAAVAGCNRVPGNLTSIPETRSTLLDSDPAGLIDGPGSIASAPFGMWEEDPDWGGEWVLPPEGQLGDSEDRRTLENQTVYFGFDSASIQPEELDKVERVALHLGNNPSVNLKIEGHCDVRGTDEYNRALGERRALALRELLADLGVAPERVITESWGEDRLADAGTDARAHSRNRRGEFVLLGFR